LEFGMKMSLLEHVGIGCVGSGGGAWMWSTIGDDVRLDNSMERTWCCPHEILTKAFCTTYALDRERWGNWIQFRHMKPFESLWWFKSTLWCVLLPLSLFLEDDITCDVQTVSH
jgi:hypothetical protein